MTFEEFLRQIDRDYEGKIGITLTEVDGGIKFHVIPKPYCDQAFLLTVSGDEIKSFECLKRYQKREKGEEQGE